jgi:predicted DNA-binding transcriptional regulator YafY
VAFRFTARGIVVVRVVKALQALQAGRVTLPQLAAEMGTTERTARRYITSFEQAHVPIRRYGPRYGIERRA